MINQCKSPHDVESLVEKCPHPIFYEGDLIIANLVYSEKQQHDLLEEFRQLRPKLWNHVVSHNSQRKNIQVLQKLKEKCEAVKKDHDKCYKKYNDDQSLIASCCYGVMIEWIDKLMGGMNDI
jgi:hypothetical protein